MIDFDDARGAGAHCSIRGGLNTGANLKVFACDRDTGGNRPASRTAASSKFGEGRSSQSTPGGQKRNRLKAIRFARAIGANEDDRTGSRRYGGGAIVPKIGKRQLADPDSV